MLDGMPIDGAVTRCGVNWCAGQRIGHAGFIGENQGSSKRKSATRGVKRRERLAVASKPEARRTESRTAVARAERVGLRP